MPHSPAEKKKALTRLRRIRGQADALERALEVGSDCGAVLQQLAAIRGAVNGLMAEVLESHLRETFGDVAAKDAAKRSARDESVQQAIALVRSYLK
jgi:DNA-binding FrmR family transcriptional regulator